MVTEIEGIESGYISVSLIKNLFCWLKAKGLINNCKVLSSKNDFDERCVYRDLLVQKTRNLLELKKPHIAAPMFENLIKNFFGGA